MPALPGPAAAGRYVLWLRDAAGAVHSAVVTASRRTGPAGHRIYVDDGGGLQVEITGGGEHRVLRCSAGLRITSLACLS
ncbi:DUF6296 family protein [Kitasatospora sp. NPDC054939]